MFLSSTNVSDLLHTNKNREQKFENAPLSIGDETYGDVMIREEKF